MYNLFAQRYVKGKRAANSVNIIARLSITVIAVAVCAQILVLSVFNGFESLVKSMFSSFYSDLRIEPVRGKILTAAKIDMRHLEETPGVEAISFSAEGKALLKNDESQAIVTLKGVDANYRYVSGLASKVTQGKYDLGSESDPKLVAGSGVQQAAALAIHEAFEPSQPVAIMAKRAAAGDDALSEGLLTSSGVFAVQQEIDNEYVITRLDFAKAQMNFSADEYSAIEIKVRPHADIKNVAAQIQASHKDWKVKTRIEQNPNLYKTMQTEKFAIYAIFSLILLISSFTTVSALTMLVIDKKKDISILQSMGLTTRGIRQIFLRTGVLLGMIGSLTGMTVAVVICLLQIKFHIIPLTGGTFLIDYFPVKLEPADVLIVFGLTMAISFLASYFPAAKAARAKVNLRS